MNKPTKTLGLKPGTIVKKKKAKKVVIFRKQVAGYDRVQIELPKGQRLESRTSDRVAEPYWASRVFVKSEKEGVDAFVSFFYYRLPEGAKGGDQFVANISLWEKGFSDGSRMSYIDCLVMPAAIEEARHKLAIVANSDFKKSDRVHATEKLLRVQHLLVILKI